MLNIFFSPSAFYKKKKKKILFLNWQNELSFYCELAYSLEIMRWELTDWKGENETLQPMQNTNVDTTSYLQAK